MMFSVRTLLSGKMGRLVETLEVLWRRCLPLLNPGRADRRQIMIMIGVSFIFFDFQQMSDVKARQKKRDSHPKQKTAKMRNGNTALACFLLLLADILSSSIDLCSFR